MKGDIQDPSGLLLAAVARMHDRLKGQEPSVWCKDGLGSQIRGSNHWTGGSPN